MSLSEFRYNKKRKHYAYIFKRIGNKYKCLLLSSKPTMAEIKHKKNHIRTKITINVRLFRHPNPLKIGQFYLIPKIYIDNIDSFSEKVLTNWSFDKNDKRKVKRLKKPATTPLER